jgi:hypothetical protein
MTRCSISLTCLANGKPISFSNLNIDGQPRRTLQKPRIRRCCYAQFSDANELDVKLELALVRQICHQ